MGEVVYGSAREIRRGIAEMIRPPQQTTVAESVARNLHIVNPSGARERWNPDTAPYMVEPLNLVRSRRYEGLIFMGPARSGKTIALGDGVIAYSIVDDPADCMVVEKSKDDAEDYSKTRLRRAIHGSPELAKRLSPRAHDDNVYLKTFRSGMNIRFGWPSLGQLSGKDVRRVLILDADNATGDMKITETWGLALKRTQTYMSSGFCLAESSPAEDYDDAQWTPSHPHEAPPAEGIASLYNMGDRRMYYWPCPECRQPFCAAPGLGLFVLPGFDELVERLRGGEDPRAIAMRHDCIWCPRCGAQIEQRWKAQMLRTARWVGQGQKMHSDGSVTGELLDVRVPSFWLGGVAAAYQSWSSLVERELQAIAQYARTGETKPLKTTRNVDQALPFISPLVRKRNDIDQIASRRESLPQGIVPRGVRFLIATVDVQAGQRRGFVVQVIGFGAHREKWVIDRFALKTSRRQDGADFAPLDPGGYVEDWDVLIDKAISRRFPLEGDSSRAMAVRLTLCDSGGEDGVTSRAYEFHRRLRERGLDSRFRLVKGRDNGPTIEERFPDTRGRSDRGASAGDVPVIFLNTDALKDTIAADLARETPGPGYLHIPDWMDPAHVRELTAEVRTAKGWAKASSGAHNESVDLAVYAEAGYHRLRGFAINWQNPPTWAAEWDVNSEVTDGEAPRVVPGPSRRKSKFWGR